MSIADNDADVVSIPGTRRKVKVRWLHPYTIERITRLWVKRDEASWHIENGDSVAADLCAEPYFAVKEASLYVLNNYFKIRFLWWLVWRIWAYVYGYTDEQMLPIIMAGKKKLPLTAHYGVMAFSTDMRTDWMRMTKKEAEQYRAELLSAAKQLSSKSSPNTEGRDASSAATKETGATVAS